MWRPGAPAPFEALKAKKKGKRKGGAATPDTSKAAKAARAAKGSVEKAAAKAREQRSTRQRVESADEDELGDNGFVEAPARTNEALIAASAAAQGVTSRAGKDGLSSTVKNLRFMARKGEAERAAREEKEKARKLRDEKSFGSFNPAVEATQELMREELMREELMRGEALQDEREAAEDGDAIGPEEMADRMVSLKRSRNAGVERAGNSKRAKTSTKGRGGPKASRR